MANVKCRPAGVKKSGVTHGSGYAIFFGSVEDGIQGYNTRGKNNPQYSGGWAMNQNAKIRMGWIKGMYGYTIFGAGGSGLGMILAPELSQRMFGMGDQDPIFFGVAASIWLAFGVMSIFGLRSPLKFLPVLCMQLLYKSVWVIGVIIPLIITGRLPDYAGLIIVIMVSYIIGDLIAIPFHYVFAGEKN